MALIQTKQGTAIEEIPAHQNLHTPSLIRTENTVEEYIEVAEHVRLHVRDWGVGKPIVFIHGWPFNDEMFEYQSVPLAMQGFRCIAISLRGFGKSDQPYGKYNYDVYAEDIKVILGKLDLEDVTLAGHSMGAAIAIRYMSLYNQARVAKLALFGAAAPVWTQREDYPYGLTLKEANELIDLCQHDRAKMVADTENFFASSHSVSKAMAEWLSRLAIQASPHATLQSLIALRDTDLRKDLSFITVPTAIFHGKEDKICSFEMAKVLQAGITGSRIVEFKKSGHGLFVEEIDKFNEELAKFVNE